MKPTIINLLILAAMDVPDSDWREKKPDILRQVITALPKEIVKLLTFDPDEQTKGYYETEKNTILLEIKIINMPLKAGVQKPLLHKIKELIETKPVIIQKYWRKHRPESNTSDTRIAIDIQAA